MAIDAFLDDFAFEDVVERELTLLGALAGNFDHPSICLEVASELRRLVFVRPELVIVVVCGDLLPRVLRLAVGVAELRIRFDVRPFLSVRCRLNGMKHGCAFRQHPNANRRAGNGAGRLNELAAALIQVLGCDLRTANVIRFLDQHRYILPLLSDLFP